jgi:hypothetical protein
MNEMRQLYPQPEPPTVEVDYGDLGGKKLESNEADPGYIKAQAEYRMMIVLKSQRLLIERGVVVELDDEMKAEVVELRDFWRQEHGKELPGSDKMVYVLHIALGTPDDLTELVEAVSRRSSPTEVSISEANGTFRGEVEGA